MADATRSMFPGDMQHATEARPGGPLAGAVDEAVESWRRLAREKPVTAALWALGIGIVLGWRLRG
jgi:hypothetical protein